MPGLSGQYLGRYQLIEQLGEGGMAVVYRAYDTRLEREVAVKIIRQSAFPPEMMEGVLKRFEREAKSLARLSHPNIVKVHDFGEHEGSPFLVLEYLPGGTLKEKLGKPTPWPEAVKQLLPIARGVAYAHEQGIIHRDIKPANILLTKSGEPMLSDFGIAKILEMGQTTALTGTGMAIGTPDYMAPEQWTGKTSPQSDLYSLGVVLYEMVTGRKPYVADTPAAILLKQATEPLPRPGDFVPNLPEFVECVLVKTLAKNPEDRYLGVSALIEAIESLFPVVSFPPTSQRPGGLEPLKPPLPVPTPSISTKTMMKDGGETVFPTVTPLSSPTQPGQAIPAPSSKVSAWLMAIRTSVVILIAMIVAGLSFGGKLFSATPGVILSQPISEKTAVPVPSTLAASPAPTSSKVTTPVVTTVPEITETSTLSAGAVQVSPIDGMLMHYVPFGTFTMGDTADHAFAECQKTKPGLACKLSDYTDEEPVHEVYMDAFWIDETNVTNTDYKGCVKSGACQNPDTLNLYYSDNLHGDYPVVFISWKAANTYCQWAGRRLPTEAEWEKAARGTDGRTYPWGEGAGKEYANYNLSVGDLSKVRSYPKGRSPYGLYDMAGNASEWVADWYQPNYYETLGNLVSNPQGPSFGQSHVIKGGDFFYNLIQSAYRGNSAVSTSVLGFRCAKSAK